MPGQLLRSRARGDAVRDGVNHSSPLRGLPAMRARRRLRQHGAAFHSQRRRALQKVRLLAGSGRRPRADHAIALQPLHQAHLLVVAQLVPAAVEEHHRDRFEAIVINSAVTMQHGGQTPRFAADHREIGTSVPARTVRELECFPRAILFVANHVHQRHRRRRPQTIRLRRQLEDLLRHLPRPRQVSGQGGEHRRVDPAILSPLDREATGVKIQRLPPESVGIGLTVRAIRQILVHPAQQTERFRILRRRDQRILQHLHRFIGRSAARQGQSHLLPQRHRRPGMCYQAELPESPLCDGQGQHVLTVSVRVAGQLRCQMRIIVRLRPAGVQRTPRCRYIRCFLHFGRGACINKFFPTSLAQSSSAVGTLRAIIHSPPMPSFRYRAFISYCHQDRKAAARLQAALENFRPPADAVSAGRVAERIRPVFRDREVLGSSHDLSAAIRDALEDSAALIVVCSPRAAASKWVAAEIGHFVERRGPENIFCLIVDGEPNAADPAQECLPEPLRHAQSGREVLAADARANADGWRDAVLKIIAGLTGLPFTALARREQRKQRRRAVILSTAGILLATIFGALAVYSARQAAAAKKSAHNAELIAAYLADVLSKFSPRQDRNAARASLLPVIDASATEESLSRLADEPLALLRVRHILGRAYLELNAADRALPLLEANATLAAELLGPDHRTTGINLGALGNTYNALGQHERGAEIHRQLLDRALRLHGEKSEEALAAMTNLAVSLEAAGRNDEARELRIRAYEVGRDIFPVDHVAFHNVRRNYAGILWHQGKVDQALVRLEELYRDQLKSPGPDHLGTLETQGFLGEAYEANDAPEKAAAAYAGAAEGLTRIHGDNDSRAIFCAFRLVHILHALGRKDEAAAATKHYFGKPPDPQKLGIIGKKPSDLPR